MQFTEFLGQSTDAALANPIFSGLTFKKTLDHDLPEVRVYHTCQPRGVDVQSTHDGIVTVIFFYQRYRSLSRNDEISSLLRSTRSHVHRRLGTPTSSGDPRTDPVLGEFGAWDRFDTPGHFVHVEYQAGSDNVKMITLMRPDVAP